MSGNMVHGDVQRLLNEIEYVCQDFNLEPVRKTLASVKNFAGQSQYLDVAVLGQFKAGKSSFLNTLAGTSVLPVGNIPVTSVITRLRYGPRERAVVSFGNGKAEEISVSEIHQYVSEEANPENHKNVLVVDIELPQLEAFPNIRLVDTPGIGSIWKHNTETTTQWFPETGGALFLVSAERPIAESELQLLREVYQYSPALAVVIAKVDLYAPEHVKEIERFTADALRREFETELPIFEYSAMASTAEYRQHIADRFISPLVINRDQVFHDVLRHKTISLANNCLSYLEIAYQVSLKRDTEKEKLKAAILDEHLNNHFVRRELQLIIASYKERTRNAISDYLKIAQPAVEEKMTHEYADVFPGFKGNLWHLTRQFESWMRKSLETELKEILLDETKSYELLHAVRNHLSFYLRSFRERLEGNVEQVLGVKMGAKEWDITVLEIKKPSISISRSFDSHLDMLGFLFPMAIFRNVFRVYFQKQITYEVDKNFHRLVSSLTERVNRQMDDLMNQALAYMTEELSMIEALLTEQAGDITRVNERLTALKEGIKAIQGDAG